MRIQPWLAVAVLASALDGGLTAGRAEEPSAFTQRVAPVLRPRCLACHGGPKKSGGLDLSTRERMLQGGDTGAAIVECGPWRSTRKSTDCRRRAGCC